MDKQPIPSTAATVTALVPDDLPERLINKRALKRLVPVSDQTIGRWENETDEEGEPRFPRRIQLGRARVAWRLSEILNWISRREQITADQRRAPT